MQVASVCPPQRTSATLCITDEGVVRKDTPSFFINTLQQKSILKYNQYMYNEEFFKELQQRNDKIAAMIYGTFFAVVCFTLVWIAFVFS